MTSATPAALDPEQVRAFGARMLSIYTGGCLSLLIDIGLRTGLFDAAAAGPSTSAEPCPGLVVRRGAEHAHDHLANPPESGNRTSRTGCAPGPSRD